MALLNADSILGADDLPTQDVEVPEWGGTVRVRGLTGAERDKLESSLVETKGNSVTQNMDHYRAKIVVLAAIDDKGYPLFEQKHIKKLSAKSAKALDRVAEAASKLSGMSQEDVKELTESFD